MEDVAKIVGLAASLSLPASFLFDWGFFNALGLSLRQVPTSLIDHAKSAVFWFPLALVMGGCIAASQMLLIRLTSQMSPPTLSESKERQDFAARWRSMRKRGRALVVSLVSVGGAFIAVYLVVGDVTLIFLLTGIGFLWVAFAVWSVVHPAGLQRWSADFAILVAFAPPAALVLWGVGDMTGAAVHFAPLSTKLTVTGSAPQDVAIIRYMDKGLLVRTEAGTAEFFQWSVITTTETPSKFREYDGVLCTWLHRCGWTLPDQYGNVPRVCNAQSRLP